MTDAGRVTMSSPSGATYDLTVRWNDGATAGDRRLLAVLDPDDIPALDGDQLFHLVPAARPALLGVEPGLATVLELRADDSLVGTDGSSAAAWLAGSPERLSTARWFVAALTQPDAAAPVRTRTLWDHTVAVGPDADPTAVVEAGAAFLREQHPEELAGIADLDGLGALFGTILGAPVDVDPLPQLATLLTESGVAVEHVDDGALAFPVQGVHGTCVCLAEVSRHAGALVLYAVLPENVDVSRLIEAWELVGRFNGERPSGTVQLDAATGRTVVRTSLLVDVRPSRALLRRLLERCLANVDDALPVFERFAAGASVEESLAAVQEH